MTHPVIDLDRGAYNRRVHARWRKGAAVYGDRSFYEPIAETCRQILEEIEDTCGWLFVAWIQARRARGDVIDLAAREQLERDFLAAAPIADSHDPVESIAWIAGCQFTRWQLMRQRLARALHEIELRAAARNQPEQRGRRGSISNPRSSD